MSNAEARKAIDSVLDLFELFGNSPSDCTLAMQSEMSDYEDALIAYSALSAGVDIIVTRNKKDFANSPVPAFTPDEFLRDFKPADVQYDMVELFGETSPAAQGLA